MDDTCWQLQEAIQLKSFIVLKFPMKIHIHSFKQQF